MIFSKSSLNSELTSSAREGDLAAVKRALNAGADINSKDTFGETSIMIASIYGYVDVVQLLIDNKADLDIQNNSGFTAMMMALSNGHVAVIKSLLEAGAKLDLFNYSGKTVLMNAVLLGNVECVKLLLEYGADVEQVDASNESASAMALRCEYGEIADFLENYQNRLKEQRTLETVIDVNLDTGELSVKIQF